MGSGRTEIEQAGLVALFLCSWFVGCVRIGHAFSLS